MTAVATAFFDDESLLAELLRLEAELHGVEFVLDQVEAGLGKLIRPADGEDERSSPAEAV